MIRLFVSSPRLFQNQDILLSEPQSHYLHKVMRLEIGHNLLIFNGQDGEWSATITGVAKRQLTLKTTHQTRRQKKEGDLWLLFSPLKPKYQLFLEEKATELGVGCLWPVRCDRTSLTHIKKAKMEAHICEAAEQSQRLTVPSLHSLTPLSDVLNTWPLDRLLLFGDETRESPCLSELTLPSSSLALLIGPEGGFTPQELNILRAHPQSQGITLSPHILRAETAAISGVAYLQLKKLEQANEGGDSLP